MDKILKFDHPNCLWDDLASSILIRRRMLATTYHQQIPGGALSVVVIAERRYGPCRLSDDNNKNCLNVYVLKQIF